jgi:hypothetical protein
VAHAERAAGDRVRRGDVAGSVVGHDALDRDAVRLEEGERSPEAGDRLAGVLALALEHLGVGEPGVVVDHHVHELPARAAAALRTDLDLVALAGDPVAGATHVDAAELLHVDVDELAGPGELVAVRGLGRLQPRALAEPDPLEPGRHRRDRHRQRLGDLGGGHPQPPQRLDRRHPLRGGLVRDPLRRRAEIVQTGLALLAETPQPAIDGAVADSGGHGRLRHRPTLLKHSIDEQPPALRTGPRVSVKLHPVSSLGLVASDSSQPPRRPG